MTREEFQALLAHVCGLRLTPVERVTIELAADAYAQAEAARTVQRRADLDDISVEEADHA